MEHAEIVFSPYNYLLDPAIREVMSINLENSVIVLDEAHNVEGTLREAGSGKWFEADLCDLNGLLAFYSKARWSEVHDVALVLKKFSEELVSLLRTNREKFENSRGTFS